MATTDASLRGVDSGGPVPGANDDANLQNTGAKNGVRKRDVDIRAQVRSGWTIVLISRSSLTPKTCVGEYEYLY